jgi:putative tryptophan/tyrosine transport system substrate-binding protein
VSEKPLSNRKLEIVAQHVDGRNLAIEYRWAEGEVDRLPALASELVRSRVALIYTTGGMAPALAATVRP